MASYKIQIIVIKINVLSGWNFLCFMVKYLIKFFSHTQSWRKSLGKKKRFDPNKVVNGDSLSIEPSCPESNKVDESHRLSE